MLFAGFHASPLPWIKHADALVCTSRYEGFGNVIVEALACGKPVISTDSPHGPAEILLGGQIGHLTAVGDSAAIARAMQVCLDDPRPAAISVARASRFTDASCADSHLALFDSWSAAPAVKAFGLRFSPLPAEQMVEQIVSETVSDDLRLVVTPNVDHVRLLRGSAFAESCKAAHFVCPDGIPILLYARLRGLRLSARVTGCELFHRLANHPGLAHHRLCVVAESTETASAVSDWSIKKGLESVTTVVVAPKGLADAPAAQLDLALAIRDAEPSILVMTLGAPVSEVFVNAHRNQLGRCWALCVGQAVRVELGLVQRAPETWQNLGLEWLWRVWQEPRRLTGRYVRAFAWFPVAILRDLGSSMPRLNRGHKEAGTPASASAEA